MNDDSNVYIGRAGVVFVDGVRFPKKASVFCNPFKIGKDGSREKVLAKYKQYITDKIESSPALKQKLKMCKGKGKNLGVGASQKAVMVIFLQTL